MMEIKINLPNKTSYLMLRYIDASPDDISLIDKWLEMGNNDFAYKEADLWKKRDLRHLSELKDKNKNR